MCFARRSTVTRTNMTGHEPREVWSVNLTSVKFYASLVAIVGTVLGMAWGTVTWAGGRMFEEKLNKFHVVAKPEIELMVDDKIEQHRKQAMNDYLESSAETDARLAKIEQQLTDQHERLERIENLLWELVQNGGS